MGFVESIFHVFTKSIGTVVDNIVGNGAKSHKSLGHRVSYKNYQLVRLYPSTDDEANDLRELRDAEPEDIKFWTQPTGNRFVAILFSITLVFFSNDPLIE